MNSIFFYRSVALVFSLFLGLSCSEGDSPPQPINNEYELDNTVFEIRTNMYWETDVGQGKANQIVLFEPLIDSPLYDMIIISPVSGPSSLEGTYVYSKTGDIGTYDLKFVHATDGMDQLLWYTNGERGDVLDIRSMGKREGKEVYRILLSDFDLNYGYWDYLAGQWVSLGQKPFRLSYEGPVE